MENFEIKKRAGGAQKLIELQFDNVNVINHVLEIRFYWAGKGTTRIPDRGVYGPLVSAISVYSGQSFINLSCSSCLMSMILSCVVPVLRN